MRRTDLAQSSLNIVRLCRMVHRIGKVRLEKGRFVVTLLVHSTKRLT